MSMLTHKFQMTSVDLFFSILNSAGLISVTTIIKKNLTKLNVVATFYLYICVLDLIWLRRRAIFIVLLTQINPTLLVIYSMN